jgi:ABC-2 type transport system permease protein
MGVHVLVQGLIRTVIEPNMLRLAEDIQQGTLDYTLTKPADAQALISIREIRIWQTVNIALGLIVLITALVLIGDRFAPLQALIFGGALLCGSLIIYSFWLMLTTISFWVVRVESMLNLFDGFYAAGRWPVGIYPAWLRGLLTFLVPVAFAVTVPAETLVGRLDWASLALLGALTLGFLLISRLFFRIGLRNYAGASA